jgi:hypothetical protein
MTSLERPLPLPLVVVILSALSVGGFAFGLKNALQKTDHQAVSTAPLAEVSGVPVRDAAPMVAEVAPPPPVEAPKPKPVEAVEAPPATPRRWSRPRPSRPSPKRSRKPRRRPRRSGSRICTRAEKSLSDPFAGTQADHDENGTGIERWVRSLRGMRVRPDAFPWPSPPSPR